MASSHLFELIHSLSPTEKGYIKKTAFSSANGEEKSYILLFDAIANQEIYDEDKIVKKFKGTAFIKNLSKSKNHLYHVILKRLAQYHEENVIEIKIKGLVNQATVLYKKGLYEHAVIHYEKALRLALDAEELESALEIYTSLIDIYLVGSMGVTFPYEEDMKALAKKLSHENLVAQLNTKIAKYMFADDFNSESEKIEKINQVLNHSSLVKITEDDSFFAQWGKMCLYTHSYYILGEHEKAAEVKMKQLQFLKDHPAMVAKTPMRYVKHLANIINGKLNTADYHDIPPLLEELKSFQCNENLLEHVKPLQMSVYHIQSHVCFAQTNQLDKAAALLDESILWFEENDNLVSDYFKIIFYDAVFMIHFLKGDYKKCIPWMNKIAHSKTTFRKELRLSLKLNLLLLHFELKNFELISYQIKSLYREILKQENNQETTKYILRWFQDCLKDATNPSALKKSAEEIKSRLNKMTKSGEWTVLKEMGLFHAWVESKINQKSIAENYVRQYVKVEEEVG
jgi:hypothetical protein